MAEFIESRPPIAVRLGCVWPIVGGRERERTASSPAQAEHHLSPASGS